MRWLVLMILGLGLLSSGCAEWPTSHRFHVCREPDDLETLHWPPCMDVWPSWSADSRSVAYFHYGRGGTDSTGLYVVHLRADDSVDGPHLIRTLRDHGVYAEAKDVRLSPDGTQIAYWRQAAIWVLDVATGATRRLSRPDMSCARPDWSPDGRSLVYRAGVAVWEMYPDSGGLRIFDLETGRERALRRRGGWHVYGDHPRWSRDGKSILLCVGDPETHNLCIFRVFPDSSDLIQVTGPNCDSVEPRWWPGSEERVVFRREYASSGKMELLVIDPDGSNEHRFPSDACRIREWRIFDDGFEISPDGTRAVALRPDSCGTYATLWISDLRDGCARDAFQLTPSPCGRDSVP